MNDDLVKNIMFQEKSFDLKKGRKKHIKAEEKEWTRKESHVSRKKHRSVDKKKGISFFCEIF